MVLRSFVDFLLLFLVFRAHEETQQEGIEGCLTRILWIAPTRALVVDSWFLEP
jgi:hypothetical protein